jgi:homoserine kinase
MFVARVRVPATMANLGPGFDALGLAVGLHCEATAELSSEDSFVYNGDSTAFTADNLMHQGWREAHRALHLEAPRVTLRCLNPIPLARGLGSSSAALVAGAALADARLEGRLGREGVLRVCAALEGHPDNVAPAVLGGFTASVMRADEPLTSSFVLPSDVQVLVAVPDFELKTSEARAALPAQYSREDMVFNLSRAALWVAAIASGRLEWLREACRDRLHQPYRARLVPGLEAAIEDALAAGALAAFLSGAGPSLGALVTAETLDAVEARLQRFSSRVLRLRPGAGYEISAVAELETREVEVARGR